MRYLGLDWERAFGFLEALGKITPATRQRITRAELKAVFETMALGEDGRALLAAGIVVEAPGSAIVRVTEAFHDTHKLLRALQRVPLFAALEEETLARYVAEHFDEDERYSLGRVEHGYGYGGGGRGIVTRLTSVAHTRGLFEAREPAAWEAGLLERMTILGRGRTPAARLDAEVGADLVLLLRHFVGGPGHLRARELPRLFPELTRARLALAVELGLRYGVLFAGLQDEGEVVLFQWPRVHARLRHGAPRLPPATSLSEAFVPTFALDDLQHLLVCAGDGLRLKASGFQLFVAAERELARGFTPLPEWLSDADTGLSFPAEWRVEGALQFALAAHLVQLREDGRASYLDVSAAGWDWLGLAPRARHATFLAPLRAALTGAGGEADGGPFSVTLRAQQFAPRGREQAIPRALAEVFGTLRPGQAVPVRDFLVHHACASNPLPALVSAHPARFEEYSEEDLEDAFVLDLRDTLSHWLIPFGGVRVGLSPQRELALELTSTGRYLLGLAQDFELAHAREDSRPVRVQPDFEVVFVSPSPMLEARIGRFAERKGKGVGVLFRITRDSILAAARAGLGAEEVLATLGESTATPLPANVVHEIKAWFARCRHFELEPVELLRCPDAETAARVFALGARYLERLGDTLLALHDPAKRSELLRACAKQGLFLGKARGGDGDRRQAPGRESG